MLAGCMANGGLFLLVGMVCEDVTIVILFCVCKEGRMDPTQLNSRSWLEDLTSLPIPIRGPYRLRRIVLFFSGGVADHQSTLTYIKQIYPPHRRGVS